MFSMMGMSGGGRLTHAPRAAQQSVHLTCGILRLFRAFFWLRVFFCFQAESTPAHTQLTQTVRLHAVFLELVRANQVAGKSCTANVACRLFLPATRYLAGLSYGFLHEGWWWNLACHRVIIWAGEFTVWSCARDFHLAPKDSRCLWEGSVKACNLTQREAEVWESARFSSSFNASAVFRFRAWSTLRPHSAYASR